jgi:hypothetical protein
MDENFSHINDSLLREYYRIMISDLQRRINAIIATGIGLKRSASVEDCDYAPRTAVKKQRTVVGYIDSTPMAATAPPSTGSTKKIKKYNAPRGAEYSPSSKTYNGGVRVIGKFFKLPKTNDPDIFVIWRKNVLELAASGGDGAISRIKQYIASLNAIKADEKTTTISSNSTEASTGPVSPVSSEEAPRSTTPARLTTATTVNSKRTSPLSVPHKISSSSTEVDVLRFRDKYYCRVSVFGEFVQTSMRSSRTEADNDMMRLSSKIKGYSSYFRNPLVNQFKKNQVIEQLKDFATSLDGTAEVLKDAPMTEIRHKTSTSVSSTTELPKGVYKIRNKYYSSMVAFGKSISTPLRDTVSEVVDDRQAFADEFKKYDNVDLTEDGKLKAIEQIKEILEDRLLGDDFKTPKKAN